MDHFLNKSELGIYALAVNLTRLIYLIPLGISSVMVAYNTADDLERVINNLNKLLRISTFVVFTACLLALPLVDFFIPFFYGIDFTRSAVVFKILLAGMVPLSAVQILTSFFAGRAKLIHNLVSMIILFGFTILLDYLLIPRFGIVGSSWGSVAANFITCAYLLFIYRQMTFSGLSKIFYITVSDLKELKIKTSELLHLLRQKLT